MQIRILSLIVLLSATILRAQDPFFATADAFFKKYVHDGTVDYAAIKANPGELSTLVGLVAKGIQVTRPEDQKAFIVNAYNITVINSIVNHMPIKSVMDVPGFFKEEKHMIAGSMMTLNDMETNLVRNVYKDPQFHFVLVCGAVSCPKLASFAFTPALIDNQLMERTKLALNDLNFTKVSGNSVQLSEIFKWYASDFATGSALIKWINLYRPAATKLKEPVQVSYYTYDWSLNGKK